MINTAERERGELVRLPPAQAASSPGNFAETIEALIEQVQACERAFDTVNAAQFANPVNDVVFVDDFAACVDWCQPDAEASLIPRGVDLAGRYSAMLKAALHVLLQIRELHLRTKG